VKKKKVRGGREEKKVVSCGTQWALNLPPKLSACGKKKPTTDNTMVKPYYGFVGTFSHKGTQCTKRGTHQPAKME
jgi:hypothetical protein